MVESRWPQRLPLLASISFSTSRSVRCSRGRSSALGPPNGCDCPVYSCWRYQLETCFSHVISPLMMFNCRDTMWNTDSLRS